MLNSSKFNLKHALLLGSSVAAFAWTTAPAMAQNNNGSSNETVIVTGTRVQGMTAADSAAPITVLGSDALTKGIGSTDLRQALGQTVPSFSAQQFGGDTANLTLSASLRGLSPNDTLVLVNGKRRHYTGNLHVLSGDFAAGSSAPDISLIPSASIDHVEVLLDGAAAQYGTDAISGVVNFILKKKSSGGTLSVTAGQYYDSTGTAPPGESADVSFNMGLPLFDKGFVNVTVQKTYNNYTQYGDCDKRVCNPDGSLITGAVGGVPNAVLRQMTNYPFINPILGNPETNLTVAAVNAGYDVSDSVSIYATGTIGHRVGRSYENVRMPSRVLATPGSSQPYSATNTNGYLVGSTTADGLNAAPGGTFAIAGSVAPGTPGAGLNSRGQVIFSGASGSYGAPGELIFAPTGFRPQEALKEDDYQYNIGTKFNLLGWDVDANVGYGKDIDNIYTLDSGNGSLFLDTHQSPTNFYDGSFTASQFTGTIDATHPFNVGMASPLTVAVGIEAREDLYGISEGDAPSQYKEGGSSFPGFLHSDAGVHSRKNYAVYLDLALAPIEALQIDIAGRAEHYTDFGDAQIGKITARYDFSPEFGIRGTLATGFRAPTIAEEFYTATNVSPTSSTIQLPANSAASKILGLNNLKPEVSTSYSAGIVAHPFADLSVTLDAYSVALSNRIVTSSTVYSLGPPGSITSPLVNVAIAATGRAIDPTVTQIGVSSFLNGLATLTQGVDLTVNYPTDFGDMGLIDWTLAGNYNTTAISRVAPTPPVFGGSAVTFFSQSDLFNFVHNAPAEKVSLTANWSLDEFGLTFRETYWGPQKNLTTPTGAAPFYPDGQAGIGLTDIEARYNITEQLQFALGGNNIFDMRPSTVPYAPNAYGPGQGDVASASNIINPPAGAAFNPNGGYYYGRITFNF
ncbi:MAG: TonB-dependent receptor [Pseudomonadota bacterium]